MISLPKTGKEIIFILGGCRSGKSRYGLDTGHKIANQKRIFIATCQPRDEEMRKRVEKHQQERDPSWQLLEIPVRLSEAIAEHSQKETVLLVDCLTLWISNLLFVDNQIESIETYTQRLARSLANAKGTVILVSNEVGTGIVPEHELSRSFRDAVGFANQSVAACADEVILMVAGIPITIKQKPEL